MASAVKTLCLFVFSLVFFSDAALSQQVVFESTTYDFGEVRKGEQVSHDFTILNKGETDLIIRKISPACGCTAAVAQSATIPALESSYIRVTFDTRNFNGEEVKTIRVYTNDPENSSQVLSIKAKIIPDITSDPTQVSLTQVPFGQGARFQIALKVFPGENVDVLEVSSKEPLIDVKLDKATSVISGVLDSKMAIGKHRSLIAVKTSSQITPVLKIPVFVEVIGNLDFEPETLNLGLFSKEEGSITRVVKVKTRDGSDLPRFEELFVDSPYIKLDQEAGEDSHTRKIHVKVRPKGKAIIRDVIKFKTGKEEHQYSIPIFGVADGE